MSEQGGGRFEREYSWWKLGEDRKEGNRSVQAHPLPRAAAPARLITESAGKPPVLTVALLGTHLVNIWAKFSGAWRDAVHNASCQYLRFIIEPA